MTLMSLFASLGTEYNGVKYTVPWFTYLSFCQMIFRSLNYFSFLQAPFIHYRVARLIHNIILEGLPGQVLNMK